MTQFSKQGGLPVPHRIGSFILLFSLLLNFFFLGLLIAPVLRPHPPFGLDRKHGPFIDHLTEGLSSSDAAALKAIYEKQQPLLKEGDAAIRDGMKEISGAVQKPVIDPSEMQKAFQDVDIAHGKIQDAMKGLLTQVATGLSPEGRRIFAEKGLRPPDHGPNFGGPNFGGPGFDGPDGPGGPGGPHDPDPFGGPEGERGSLGPHGEDTGAAPPPN